MATTIIIISTEIKSINTNIPYLILDSCTIVDNNYLIYNNQDYYFDYLIFDDPTLIKNLNVECDNNFIITNYNFQTSIENFFAVGNCILSSKNKNNMINEIIEFIIEPN